MTLTTREPSVSFLSSLLTEFVWNRQYLPFPRPSPPVLFYPSQKHNFGRAKKKNSWTGGRERETINVTLPYGFLRGGVQIKGGVKLSVIYGNYTTSNHNEHVTVYRVIHVNVSATKNENDEDTTHQTSSEQSIY
jgi:hypothetical protein